MAVTKRKTAKKNSVKKLSPPAQQISQSKMDIVNEALAVMKSYPMVFAQWAFSETHFRDPSPDFHKYILHAALNFPKVAVAAPRGHAKSTILSFLYACHAVIFKRKRHIVILQNTLSKACGSLSTIKHEILTNNELKIFNITVEKDTQEEVIFVHPDGRRIRMIAKGKDQMGTIRGEKFEAYRPDLIIIDDLEDDKSVLNPDLRRELKRIFNDAVDPAVDFKDGGQIIFIGTVLHDDALIANMISKYEYKDYKKYKFQAIRNDVVLWTERYSREDLKKIEMEDPEKYAKEYQNDPISGLRRKFNKEDFRYWQIQQGEAILFNEDRSIMSKYKLTDCIAAISCDLAWGQKTENDYSVIMPGLLTPNNEILICKPIFKKGMRPNEIENILFNSVDKYERLTDGIVPVGFEKAMLEKVMKWLLRKAMAKRGKWLIFKDLLWDRDKITRIVTRLQPRYANNNIFHAYGMGEYEHQLIRIPDGVHDDLCFEEGTKIATPYGDKNIEEFNVGDKVITPFGIRKVSRCGWTGIKETIDLFGMKLTHNHKVFSKDKSCFVSADTVQYPCELNKLSYKEMIKWKYLKLLSLMELNTKEWAGRESIICLSQIQMKEGRILKDFMWQFMNFIGKLKFLKAFMFIILMETLLITTLKTLSVYQLVNIIVDLKIMIKKQIKDNWLKLDHWLLNGIGLKKEENGIKSMVKNVGNQELFITSNVMYVKKDSNQKLKQPNIVLKNVEIERKQLLKDVYNLTIEEDGVYYANGNLVSNCDAAQGLAQLLKNPKNINKRVEHTDTHFEWLQKQIPSAKKGRGKKYRFGKKANASPIQAIQSFERSSTMR